MTTEEIKMLADYIVKGLTPVIENACEDTTDKDGAARAIGVSVSWLNQHLSEIPCWRVGKRIIFSKRTVRHYSKCHG